MMIVIAQEVMFRKMSETVTYFVSLLPRMNLYVCRSFWRVVDFRIVGNPHSPRSVTQAFSHSFDMQHLVYATHGHCRTTTGNRYFELTEKSKRLFNFESCFTALQAVDHALQPTALQFRSYVKLHNLLFVTKSYSLYRQQI